MRLCQDYGVLDSMYISSSFLSLPTLKKGLGNTRRGVKSPPLSDPHTHTLPNITDMQGRSVKMRGGEEEPTRHERESMKAVCSDSILWIYLHSSVTQYYTLLLLPRKSVVYVHTHKYLCGRVEMIQAF